MKTVRIYGMADILVFAPPVPPGVEVWAFNDPRRAYRKTRPAARTECTRWINVHSVDHIKAMSPWGWRWWQAQTDKRILLQERQADIPCSERFPKDELLKFFGHRYFTFSAAWAAALAIYEEFERIEFYGFRLHRLHHIYGAQRHAFFYWVEEARRRGIEVTVPEEVGMDTPGDPSVYDGPLYGYETLCEYPECKFCRNTEATWVR